MIKIKLDFCTFFFPTQLLPLLLHNERPDLLSNAARELQTGLNSDRLESFGHVEVGMKG